MRNFLKCVTRQLKATQLAVLSHAFVSNSVTVQHGSSLDPTFLWMSQNLLKNLLSMPLYIWCCKINKPSRPTILWRWSTSWGSSENKAREQINQHFPKKICRLNIKMKKQLLLQIYWKLFLVLTHSCIKTLKDDFDIEQEFLAKFIISGHSHKLTIKWLLDAVLKYIFIKKD